MFFIQPAGLDIEIHLKPIAGGAHSKTLPPNITNIIQLEYATKYLEAIGKLLLNLKYSFT